MGVKRKADGNGTGPGVVDDVIHLDDFLPYQLILAADRVSRMSAAVVKRHEGLNLSHWRVLAAVAEAPGRTANEVVAVTPMDKGIVSRSVKTLIGEGLVERRASDSDGRLGHLYLTAKGRGAYDLIARDIRAMAAGMLGSLEAGEAEALQQGLKRLLQALPASERR